jgi:hypothetical protein
MVPGKQATAAAARITVAGALRATIVGTVVATAAEPTLQLKAATRAASAQTAIAPASAAQAGLAAMAMTMPQVAAMRPLHIAVPQMVNARRRVVAGARTVDVAALDGSRAIAFTRNDLATARAHRNGTDMVSA